MNRIWEGEWLMVKGGVGDLPVQSDVIDPRIRQECRMPSDRRAGLEMGCNGRKG